MLSRSVLSNVEDSEYENSSLSPTHYHHHPAAASILLYRPLSHQPHSRPSNFVKGENDEKSTQPPQKQKLHLATTFVATGFQVGSLIQISRFHVFTSHLRHGLQNGGILFSYSYSSWDI